MEVFSVIGLSLVAGAIAVILRQYKPEYAMLLTVGVGVFVLFRISEAMRPLVEQIQEVLRMSEMPAQFAGILLKALAMCFLTQIACDICRDAGEGAIASKIEMAGKVAVLGVSLPLFKQVLSIVYSLIG